MPNHTGQKEVRFLAHSELRVVPTPEGQTQRAIEGYASVFETWSEDLGGFRERVMPGAFTRALAEKQDVRALMNHDPNIVLGRSSSGSLVLEEDARGLKFRVNLPDTQAARDLHALITRGDINQCSFSFIAVKDKWADEERADGAKVLSRDLQDVDLMDISAVTFPAYRETDVMARMLFPDGQPLEMRTQLAAQRVKVEPRDHGTAESMEDVLNAIRVAVQEKFAAAQGVTGAIPSPASYVYPMETFADHVIVCKDGDSKEMYCIEWKMLDGKVVLGDTLTPVDKVYVPSPRALQMLEQEVGKRNLQAAIEARLYKDASEAPDYVPEDKKAQWVAVWNGAYKAAVKDGKEKDAAEKSAFAQANAVAGPDERDGDGAGETQALSSLRAALARHKAHMEDPANVTPESQQALMDELQAALDGLLAEEKETEEKSRAEKRDRVDDVSDPDSPDYDPEDPDFDPDWEEDEEDEDRARMQRELDIRIAQS